MRPSPIRDANQRLSRLIAGGGQGQADHPAASRSTLCRGLGMAARDGLVDQPLDQQRRDDADHGEADDGQQVQARA